MSEIMRIHSSPIYILSNLSSYRIFVMMNSYFERFCKPSCCD